MSMAAFGKWVFSMARGPLQNVGKPRDYTKTFVKKSFAPLTVS